MKSVIEEVVEAAPSVIARLQNGLPANFPENIAEAIFSGTANAARRLEEQTAAL